jgi:hypothetical protein
MAGEEPMNKEQILPAPYFFQLTPEEKAELAKIPMSDQPAWLKALGDKKRPVHLPAPPKS